ncbi:MAG: hypothetical protein JWQ49_6668 [Edaphobacter sp.]|nr:hypothetical protein [Edaphobacter sp.]
MASSAVDSFHSACFYDNRKIMKKSINDNRKIGRGRPATGTAPLVGVRMTEELQDEIKAWAKKQEDKPPLAAAIRRLVELGLDTTKPPAQTTAKTADKAKDLAGDAINHMADKSASADEKASRKRRLISGPEEFRSVRVDRPKKK